ncbi:hypothetical protein BAZMOX_07964_6 [methanotrophic endosymbiont of Bathymodiolus azoricus (Menez Gwen)]|jgi:hypothetical protein|nr:hypothetical protein BAZMOX_07964_6 [methanotrophic endosymbiont of Bathymodiolus azoricus (Menez Gwen)]
MDDRQLDAMFSGVIGQEYDTLKLICPLAAKMSHAENQGNGAIAK